MSSRYKELDIEVNSVFSAAIEIAPAADFTEARDYLDHGEYDLALAGIAATLAEDGKRATSALYLKFVRVGEQLGFEETFWAGIRPECPAPSTSDNRTKGWPTPEE